MAVHGYVCTMYTFNMYVDIQQKTVHTKEMYTVQSSIALCILCTSIKSDVYL